MQYLSISIYEKECRIRCYLQLGGKLQPLSFFHIHFYIDKIFVEVITDSHIGENLALHVFAGTTPGSIGIEENEFVFLFRLRQYFFPAFVVKKINSACE